MMNEEQEKGLEERMLDIFDQVIAKGVGAETISI